VVRVLEDRVVVVGDDADDREAAGRQVDAREGAVGALADEQEALARIGHEQGGPDVLGQAGQGAQPAARGVVELHRVAVPGRHAVVGEGHGGHLPEGGRAAQRG
jgi:hypothetical protein